MFNMSTVHFLVVVFSFISAIQGYLHVPGMQKLPTPVDHLLRGGPGTHKVEENQNHKDASWDEFPETGVALFWHNHGPEPSKTTISSGTKNMDVIPHGKVGRSYHFDYVPKKIESLSIWDDGDKPIGKMPVYDKPKGKKSDWNSGSKDNTPNIESSYWSGSPKNNKQLTKVNQWHSSPKENAAKVSQWNDGPVDIIPSGKTSHWNDEPSDNMPKGEVSHWNDGPGHNMLKGKASDWNDGPGHNMPNGKISHWNDSPGYNMPNGKASDWNDGPGHNMPNGKFSHWNDSPGYNMPNGKISIWNDIPKEKAKAWSDYPKTNANQWEDVTPKEKSIPWNYKKNSMTDEWNGVPQSRRVKVYSKQQALSEMPKEEERMGPQQDRIVGGRDVQDGEVPWQVSLQRRSMRTGKIYHICGGSIINKEWIVTAAHCVALALMSNYRVVSGTSNLDDDNRIKERSHSYTIHKVIDAHIHHAFDMFRFRNDIALLKVSPEFDIGGSVSAINLPPPGSEFGGQAVASGWGLMQEGVRITPSRLQTVVLPLWTDDKCKKVYGNNVADTMICAGYDDGGKSVCQGDSGGPLFKGTMLIGVVSWGVGCARPGKPGVYTEVSHYVNWIERITSRH